MTFVRYTAIQMLAYIIDIGTFFLVLTMAIIGPVSANIAAKLAAGFFAFFAHRNFTFLAANNAAARGQFIKYFMLLALNIPLASAILVFLLTLLTEPVLAKFITDVVCVGLTYFLSKYFIFKDRSRLAKLDSSGADK